MKTGWLRIAAAVVAVAAGAGCTTAMKRTTPFGKGEEAGGERRGASVWLAGAYSEDKDVEYWVFPLFYRIKTDDDELSYLELLPLGVLGTYVQQHDETEVSVLAWLGDWRWKGGTNVYWRVFPLAGRGRDADFAERWGWLDGERLPEGVRPIAPRKRAVLRRAAEASKAAGKTVWKGTGDWVSFFGFKKWVEVPGLDHYSWGRRDGRWWLAKLFGNEARVEGRWVDGEGKEAAWDGEREAERYVVEGAREWGNLLLAKGRVVRRATFDAASGAKTGEERRSDGHVLGVLYRWSGQEGVAGEEDWARRSVLWKLWNWERRGGAVSADVLGIPVWRSGAEARQDAASPAGDR